MVLCNASVFAAQYFAVGFGGLGDVGYPNQIYSCESSLQSMCKIG